MNQIKIEVYKGKELLAGDCGPFVTTESLRAKMLLKGIDITKPEYKIKKKTVASDGVNMPRSKKAKLAIIPSVAVGVSTQIPAVVDFAVKLFEGFPWLGSF